MKNPLSFINTAKTDDFENTTPFSWRDWAAVGLLVVYLIAIWVQYFVIDSRMTLTLYSVGVPAALSVILFYIYRDILVRHWRLFRIELLPNLVLAFALSILMHPMLGVIRSVFGDFIARGSLMTKVDSYDAINDNGSLILALLGTLASFGPIFVAFVEDTIFRHTLLAKIPVWDKAIILKIIVLVINSILFGAIHYWAFGASLRATIPFMFIGLFMNLIYLWTKNLWYMLMTHIFFNGLGAVASVLSLPFTVISLLGS